MSLLLKAIAWVALAAFIVGGSAYLVNKLWGNGWTSGYNESDVLRMEEQTKAKDDKLQAITTLKDSLRSQAIDFAALVTKLDEQKVQEEINIERANDILIDSIMSGNIRLYLPGQEAGFVDRGNGSGSAEEGDLTGAESRSPEEKVCELYPSSTKFLFRLTGDADQLAADYNYLVDYVKTIRKQCNASSTN